MLAPEQVKWISDVLKVQVPVDASGPAGDDDADDEMGGGGSAEDMSGGRRGRRRRRKHRAGPKKPVPRADLGKPRTIAPASSWARCPRPTERRSMSCWTRPDEAARKYDMPPGGRV